MVNNCKEYIGNLTNKANPSSQSTKYSFNTIGLTTTVKDQNGRCALNVTYDALDCVKETNQEKKQNTKTTEVVK